MSKSRSCTGGSVDVMVGAHTGADIVGALLVAPEELGVDMRTGAREGVMIARGHGRSAPATGLSGEQSRLAGLMDRILGRR